MGSSPTLATMYYPYNKSFDIYGPPRASLQRAEDYCKEQNQYKGGEWIIHSKQQYDKWWERKGKFLQR